MERYWCDVRLDPCPDESVQSLGSTRLVVVPDIGIKIDVEIDVMSGSVNDAQES